MSNIHPIQPPRRQAEPAERQLEQACAWIARLDRQLSDDEQQALQQWLQQDPAHQQALLEVASLWDKMDNLSRLADLFPVSANPPHRSSGSWRQFAAAAAVAGLLLLAGWSWQTGWLAWPQPQSMNNLLVQQQSYQTQIGESRIVALPDGSQLLLNTNSFAMVRFSDKARIIELQRGEINIEVAHDAQRPLSVVAAGKVIQAVGTVFNVQVKAAQVELIVTEGKVLVETAAVHDLPQAEPMLARRLSAKALAITSGERVELDASGRRPERIEKMAAPDIAASLSWRSGKLIFRGETLAEAIAEISRYTDVKFTLADDEALKNIQVAGMFKTGDIDGLLAVFAHNFNIRHQKLADNTILLQFAI